MQKTLEFDSQWNRQSLSARYEAVRSMLRDDMSEASIVDAFRVWDLLRRDVASWKAVTEIRTRQNTSDPEARANSVAVAAASPVFEAQDADMKRMFIDSPHRDALESQLGSVAFSRWNLDVEASSPQNDKYLETQANLGNRYTELLGNMRFYFHGKPCTSAELLQVRKHPDRDVRREASIAQWAPFEQHGGELDDIFDKLVATRTSMAQSFGETSYTALAYRRLGRLDYGVLEVQALRDEIHDSIVPLVAGMVREQAQSLHIDSVMPWDESFYEAQSKIPLRIPVDQMLQGLQNGFARIDPSIGEFAENLAQSGLTDLNDRAGKAPGAFCEFLPHVSMPFVFANVTGAAGDAMTIAHETGHAFQNFCSRHHEPLEFVVPTNEAGEIHSMAMEFLILPFCDEIFGEGAEEFRRAHLRARISALPYVAAIDHFQELVYENPAAEPAERREMWLHVQSHYMPWRMDGGIPALSRGGAWQAQRHVYRFPFYYIDYGIAMCCALMLYSESRTNYRAAVERYLLLCQTGGTLSFKQMLQAVQMRSPFERGILTDAVYSFDRGYLAYPAR